MNYLLEVCLVALTLVTGVAPSATAQSQTLAAPAMQKGISVQLPVTSNAVTIPEADRQDAVIVSITADGSVYVGVNRISPAALAETVKDALSNRPEKKLYLKADARTSYANLIGVIDAARASGVNELSLISAQQESKEKGTHTPPKGIQTWLVCDCSKAQR